MTSIIAIENARLFEAEQTSKRERPRWPSHYLSGSAMSSA
jgi:hypothetical protein